jgi:type IV pilus assembly protein PilZ
MDPDFKGPEKRAFPRAPIELKIDYKRLNSFFADYTKNISRGGTFIGTPKPLPIGTAFSFQITIPGLPSAVHLLGEVSWVREDNVQPGMGIRFIFADESERKEFESAVEKLMIEHLGPVLYKKLLSR